MQIRVAFSGLGWVVREVWLARIIDNPNFIVVGGIDPSENAREKTRSQYPGFQFFPNNDEMAKERPDLVFIASPNFQHCDDSCFFLDRDISVFVEKPICLSVQQLIKIKRSTQSSKGKLLLSNAARYREDVSLLIDYLNQHENHIYSVSVEWVRAKGVPSPGSWFTYSKLSGGGVMYDLGWHMMDLALHMSGYPMPSNAVSIMRSEGIRQSADWRGDGVIHNPLPTDVEDSGMGMLAFENGLGIFIKTAWTSHNPLDYCKLLIEGEKYNASLYTTFGFTPNRVSEPKLEIFCHGKTLFQQSFSHNIGSEYDALLSKLPDLLFNDISNAFCIEELMSLTSSIEMLYKSSEKASVLEQNVEYG